MSAMVTGATGFIGRHVAAALASTHDVCAVDRAHGFDLLVDDPRQLFRGGCPDVLVHLAWIAEHGTYRESPANDAWLDATQRLGAAYVTAGGRRIVFAGTCIDDGDTRYGRAKRAAAAALEGLDESGVAVAVARIHHLFGAGEHPDRLVPHIIQHALRGDEIVLRTPAQVIDLLDVRDVGGAIAALASSSVTGPVDIASGIGTTVRDVALLVADAAPCTVRDDPTASAGPPIVGDASRLRDEVGFVPARSLRSGIADAVDWWRAHG